MSRERFSVCDPQVQGSGELLTATEYIVSPADFVSIIPEDLKPEAVAPLLCGMYPLSLLALGLNSAILTMQPG